MKILCSDFDGTLAKFDVISKDTIKAINDFQKAGNLFGIVTGRTYKSLKPHLIRNNIKPDFLILSNGALIIKDGKTISTGNISKDSIKEIVNIANKHCISSVAISDGFCYEILKSKTRLSLSSFILKIGNALYLKSSNVDTNKVIAMCLKDFDTKRCIRVSEDIVNELGEYVEVKINAGINIDITANNVTKESAINKVIEEFEDSIVYTVGDSLNDVGMIKMFNGYAMRSGNKEVKRVAKKQVNSVKEVIEDIMEG